MSLNELIESIAYYDLLALRDHVEEEKPAWNKRQYQNLESKVKELGDDN